nr:TIGR03915 family putative DNA repair protein [uncultured Capnocytophaga sp.]
MTHLLYDSSFEGFLTAVFITFERRYSQVIITPECRHTPTLWDEEERVYTDPTKAQRILKKIKTIWSTEGITIVLQAFLSEETRIENHLLEAIRLMIQYPEANILENYGHEAIAHIRKAAKSVGREVHRVKEFVRFEQVGTLYFAKIVPQYDVLPLVIPHFKARFSDQEWVLFDPDRAYGFYYDLKEVISFTPADKNFGKTSQSSDDYEQLWKTYFQHINISERKNTRYQLRNMPKRYWQYLPETK